MVTMSSSKKNQGNKQIHSYQRAMMSKNATLLKTARPGNPFPPSTVPFDPTQPAGPAKFTSAHSSSISPPQSSRTRNAWGTNNKNGSKSESQSRNHSPQHSNGRNNYPQSSVAAVPTRIDQSEFPALASTKPSRPKSAEKPNSPKRNANSSSSPRPRRGSSNPSTPQRTFNRKQTQRPPRSDTKSKRTQPQSASSGEKEDSVWLQYDENETPKKPAPSNSGNSPQKSLRGHSPNNNNKNNTNTKGRGQDSNGNGDRNNAVSGRSGGSNKENDSMAPNPTNSSRFPTNDYPTRNHYHDNRGRGGYHRGGPGPMQPPPNGAINVDVDSFDRQPGYYDQRPPMFDNFNGPPPGRRGGGPRGRGRGGHRGRGRGLRGRGGSPQHRGNRNVARMNPNSDPSMHWTSRKRFVPNGAIPNFTPEFKPYRRPSYKAFLQAIKDREKRFDEQLAQFQRDRKYYATKHVKDHMTKLREERDRVKEEKLRKQLQQQRQLQVAMDQQNRASQQPLQGTANPTTTSSVGAPHINPNTAAQPQQTPRGPNESRSRHYFTQIGLHPVTPLQQQLINGVTLSPANQPSHPPKLAMPPNLPQNLPLNPSVLGLPALSNPSSTNITTPPLSALPFTTNTVNTQNPIQLLHGLSPNPLSMPSGTTTTTTNNTNTNMTGNTGGKVQRVSSSNVRAPSPGTGHSGHSLENTQHTGSFKAHHRGKTPGKTLSANSAPWKSGNWSKVGPSTSSNVQSVESSQPISAANTTTSSRGASPSVANGNGRETASPYPGPGAVSGGNLSGINPTTHSASQQSQCQQQMTKSSTHTPQAQPTANSQMPSISLSSVPTGQSQKQLQTPKLSLMQSLGSIPQTSAAGPIQFGQSLYTQHQAQARQHQIQHITQQQQHQQQQHVLLQQQAMNQIWNHQHNAQQQPSCTPRAQGQDSYRNVNVQAPPPPPPQWSGVNPQQPGAPQQYSQEFRPPPISPATNPHQYPAASGPAPQPGTPYNQWSGPGRGNYAYPPHNPTQWQPQHHQQHWQQPPYYQ